MPRPRLTLDTHARSTGITGSLKAATIQTLPVADLSPHPDNPGARAEAGDDMDELIASINHLGVLEPVIVAPDGDGWVVLAGNRRLEAARRACLVEIPAVIRPELAARHTEVMLDENTVRLALTPIEEACAYKRLQDRGMTQAQIARRIHRTQAFVSQRMRLLELPEQAQALIDAGRVGPREAYDSLTKTDAETIKEAAEAMAGDPYMTWTRALSRPAAPVPATPARGDAEAADPRQARSLRLAHARELMALTPRAAVFAELAAAYILAGAAASAEADALIPAGILDATGSRPQRQQKAWSRIIAWCECHIGRTIPAADPAIIKLYYRELCEKTSYSPQEWEISGGRGSL